MYQIHQTFLHLKFHGGARDKDRISVISRKNEYETNATKNLFLAKIQETEKKVSFVSFSSSKRIRLKFNARHIHIQFGSYFSLSATINKTGLTFAHLATMIHNNGEGKIKTRVKGHDAKCGLTDV